MRLLHEFECFNAPDVGVRIGFKRLRAERAAKRDHPLAVFDSCKPFAAGDGFLADSALHVGAVEVAGIKLPHTISFLSSGVSGTAVEVGKKLNRRERHR